MKKNLPAVGTLLVAALLGGLVGELGSRAILRAYASPPAAFAPAVLAASQYPALVTTAVELLVATPTEVPAVPMNGREGLIIQNLGPNAIYCREAATDVVALGLRVPPGGALPMALSFSLNTGGGRVWCQATGADQVAPANTRVGELR